jgi:hypothetical protein
MGMVNLNEAPLTYRGGLTKAAEEAERRVEALRADLTNFPLSATNWYSQQRRAEIQGAITELDRLARELRWLVSR